MSARAQRKGTEDSGSDFVFVEQDESSRGGDFLVSPRFLSDDDVSSRGSHCTAASSFFCQAQLSVEDSVELMLSPSKLKAFKGDFAGTTPMNQEEVEAAEAGTPPDEVVSDWKATMRAEAIVEEEATVKAEAETTEEATAMLQEEATAVETAEGKVIPQGTEATLPVEVAAVETAEAEAVTPQEAMLPWEGAAVETAEAEAEVTPQGAEAMPPGEGAAVETAETEVILPEAGGATPMVTGAQTEEVVVTPEIAGTCEVQELPASEHASAREAAVDSSAGPLEGRIPSIHFSPDGHAATATSSAVQTPMTESTRAWITRVQHMLVRESSSGNLRREALGRSARTELARALGMPPVPSGRQSSESRGPGASPVSTAALLSDCSTRAWVPKAVPPCGLRLPSASTSDGSRKAAAARHNQSAVPQLDLTRVHIGDDLSELGDDFCEPYDGSSLHSGLENSDVLTGSLDEQSTSVALSHSPSALGSSRRGPLHFSKSVESLPLEVSLTTQQSLLSANSTLDGLQTSQTSKGKGKPRFPFLASKKPQKSPFEIPLKGPGTLSATNLQMRRRALSSHARTGKSTKGTGNAKERHERQQGRTAWTLKPLVAHVHSHFHHHVHFTKSMNLENKLEGDASAEI